MTTNKEMSVKNILITGQRQIGKTTLIRKVVESHDLNIAGYQTLPYYVQDTFYGYEMMDLITKEKRIISKKQIDGKFQPLEKTFRDFGVLCLQRAMETPCDAIILDEIGRFERNVDVFIQSIHKVLDSNHFVIGVLKKEPIDFIEKIKLREDILLLDLDVKSPLESYDIIEKHYNIWQS